MTEAPVELLREALIVALVVSLPVLVVAVAVGLITAILQSATQVQDQSVSAVPRLVACAIALLALAGWMVSKLVSFAQTMFAGVP
ncbi:MAG: flagellar biosynthetic protein FliQ [Phycisphaerales bacterium]